MTPGRQYAFGRFRLDAEAGLLFRDEERIQLAPKAVDVLILLVENRGAPVRRQDLFQKIWSDAVVEDGTLTSHISLLRRMLGEEFIEVLRVLHKLGLDRTDPVTVRGRQVSPRDVVAASLPDPATLGPQMTVKTCAGTWVRGTGK